MHGEAEEENKSIICSINCLPTELLFDVLLLLPADFLYERARFVCQKWHEIIHSDDFTNAQTLRSTSGLLLHFESNINQIYVTAIGGRVQTSELSCRSRISSSCNGLVVEFSNEYPSLLRVTNPATKQPFLIPPIPATDGDSRVHHCRCGIGYSAASMVYKLTLPYYSYSQRRLGLLILTAGVDRTWRNVEVHPFSDYVRFFLYSSKMTTSEGYLHWEIREEVLTLNVETENFTFSRLPLSNPNSFRYALLPTGRNLSLLCRSRNRLLWEILEMSGEWRKTVSLKIDLRPLKSRLQPLAARHDKISLRPIGWVKYPVVLAFRFFDDGRTFVFYNLDTHEIETIELPKSEWCYRVFRIGTIWYGLDRSTFDISDDVKI